MIFKDYKTCSNIVHFEYAESYLCNRKVKAHELKLTKDMEKITCKNCLYKINMTNGLSTKRAAKGYSPISIGEANKIKRVINSITDEELEKTL